MDNRYFNFNCPPLMSDGRFITNYMESRVFEQNIRNLNKLESALDYKDFLQKNATLIMNNEITYNENNNTCVLSESCPNIANKNLILERTTQSGCVKRQ